MENNPVFDTEALKYAVENEFDGSADIIGKSYLRNDIYALKLGKGERKILFCAEADGSADTAKALLDWLRTLKKAASVNSLVAGCNVRSLLAKCSLLAIPCLNPDGADLVLKGIPQDSPFAERLTRISPSGDFSGWAANARGIDLRRNFNSRWVECKLAERRKQKLFPSSSGFGGEYPESEFESAALCLYIKKERPHVFATISLGEGCIKGFYPPKEKAPEERRGAEVCAAITKISHSIADEEDFYGSPEGWFCSLFGKPAFRISIPQSGSADGICTMFSAVV